MGFLVSQHAMAKWVRYTPSPFFWAFPPWRACEVEVRYPPSKGVSQRYLRDTLWKQGKRVRYPPLRYYLERVLSHWAAKRRSGWVGLRRHSSSLPNQIHIQFPNSGPLKEMQKTPTHTHVLKEMLSTSCKKTHMPWTCLKHHLCRRCAQTRKRCTKQSQPTPPRLCNIGHLPRFQVLNLTAIGWARLQLKELRRLKNACASQPRFDSFLWRAHVAGICPKMLLLSRLLWQRVLESWHV